MKLKIKSNPYLESAALNRRVPSEYKGILVFCVAKYNAVHGYLDGKLVLANLSFTRMLKEADKLLEEMKTPEEEVDLLREAIHDAMTHMEKDRGIYSTGRKDLILAYIILEQAFMETAKGESVLMDFSEELDMTNEVDREKRRQQISEAIKEAEDQELYEISEHLTSEIDCDE